MPPRNRADQVPFELTDIQRKAEPELEPDSGSPWRSEAAKVAGTENLVNRLNQYFIA